MKTSFFRMTLFIVFVLPCSVGASGLSTNFVDFKVSEVIPVGTPYDLTARMGKRVDLKNMSDQDMAITVQAIAPTPEQLKGNVLAVPDPSWIHITPSALSIRPHQMGYADIVIKVPKKRAHRGKTYQVMIWSRGQVRDAQGGVVINPALLSRLRFSTR